MGKHRAFPALKSLFLAWLALAVTPELTLLAGSEPNAAYDEALARQVGADENGMRQYVLVILKSGPTPVPEGSERKEMFSGHFANMKRLAEAGKLILAGPLDGEDGWRGLFILAASSIEEARALAATDPVLIKGEMIAEYHTY